ncbi:zinc finger MYM-type protein 1-like [Scomber scombrus]|uniref:Zinc finger MYM-type protein 1-like n=1 Tax=Scomber scombrus TaxID=13677 RepID=A0AAV1QIP7_SCOSC
MATASCSSSDRRDVNNEEVVSVVIIGDDPALWPNVFSDCQRCELVKRGPVQMELEFPQNAEGRRFTKANYFIVMKNGEKINRTWLVYSKVKDAVMCFCCRLFAEGDESQSQLSSTNGFRNWKNLQANLKQHERSAQHIKHMDAWHTLNARLQSGTAIDQCTTDAIVERVRRAKYYAVIMDCTPDVSHNEQLSVLLRIVNCELTKGVSIHEHFMGFLVADNTTGQGLLQLHTLNLVVGDAAKSSTISLGYFGTLQRLYNLFCGSVQRWTIFQEHVKDLSVKALSTTRWECRVDAVKAVRYQLPEIVDALTAVQKHATLKKDPECASTAESLRENIMTWSFMVSTFVWYDVLYHINRVSKILQSPSVSIETLRREVMAVSGYLEEFREHGFKSAQTDAREMAEKMEVEMSWPVVRQRKRKRQFDYEGRDEDASTPEELFKREFFLHIVDTASAALRERFSNMQVFYDLYGFLYSSELLRSTIQRGKLDDCCRKLEEAIADVDAEDLKMELEGAVRSFPPHGLRSSICAAAIHKETEGTRPRGAAPVSYRGKL